MLTCAEYARKALHFGIGFKHLAAREHAHTLSRRFHELPGNDQTNRRARAVSLGLGDNGD